MTRSQQLTLVLPVLVLSGVFVTLRLLHPRIYTVFAPHEFLWVHTVMESFSVVIALGIAMLVWTTSERMDALWTLIAGASFLTAGLIDTFHFLSYQGMPVFIVPGSAARATQFWIAARLVNAMALFLGSLLAARRWQWAWGAPGVRLRTRRRAPIFSGAFAVAIIVLVVTIYFPDRIPAMFVPGQGMTPLKVRLEYLIMALMVAACLLIRRIPDARTGGASSYIQSGLAMNVLSELVFTFHMNAHDTYDLLAHIYKVVAYTFYYYGFFACSVNRSYHELRAVSSRLAEEEKLRFLGEMTACAAHEIRNPMTAVRGFLQLLDQRLAQAGSGYQREYVGLTLCELDRINGIVERMMTVARRSPREACLADVNMLLKEALDEVRHRGDGVRVVEEWGQDLPPVRIDMAQIKQVFANLIANACESMPEGGLITTRTGRADAGGVFVEFVDRGEGIPPALLPRVFDPFFSTKERGTGLGLTMVRVIMRNHGGDVTIRSIPGVGTTVTVLFPEGRARQGGSCS